MTSSTFIDNYEVKEEHGAKWVKIFNHSSKNFDFFKSESEALLSLDNKNKYSILKYLPFIKKYENKKYEFLLEYPEHLGFNRWKKTSNPLKSKTVSGFEYNGTEVTWPHDFEGLAKYHNNTFLAGMPSINLWHFAIGAYESYIAPDMFPGPKLTGWAPKEVRLWIRIANFSNIICFDICTCRRLSKNSYLHSPLLIFLIYS